MKADVYEKITSQIVAELEKGVRPWHKPWASGHAAAGSGEAVLALQRGYG